MAVVVASGLIVRSVLRARTRVLTPESARRPRVAPDPPRLDARQRHQAAPAIDTFPLAAPSDALAADPLAVAKTTAAEYRQRARYPRWSQPITGNADPLDNEEQESSGDAVALTGSYRDTMEEGDLVVDAQVLVKAAGRFHLEGSLYGKDGQQPIAWAQDTAEFPIGQHWMRLRFHGLILHERGIDGPYLIRSLALSTLTEMPVVKNGVTRNPHVTGPYTAHNFNDRPFDDPDLLEAADRIEQAIDGLQADTGS